MKTNKKILQLINHGFSNSLLSDLNENQINALYLRLTEQVTPLPAKPSYKVGEKGGVVPASDKGYSIKKNPDNTVTATPMEEDTTLDVVNDPDASSDGMGMFEDKELQEKFESKKQQKYFFLKCGDGKTQEQKKWCKMADEFAKKTNFDKLPEKKKETKETFDMGDYYKKVTSAAAGLTKKNLNQISPSVGSIGENELEKRIMKLVEKHITPKMTKKDFISLVSEQGTKEKERTKEKEKTKEKPGTPYSPKPGPAKAPKASKQEVEEQGNPTIAPSKPKTKETTKPGTPYSPKPGPAKAPKAKKENLPNWLSFKTIGIKLK
jgi:hypothetical protein